MTIKFLYQQAKLPTADFHDKTGISEHEFKDLLKHFALAIPQGLTKEERLFAILYQACRYLVINSGTSKSPEFTRQRDKYACGALAVLVPLDFEPPTGLKIYAPQ